MRARAYGVLARLGELLADARPARPDSRQGAGAHPRRVHRGRIEPDGDPLRGQSRAACAGDVDSPIILLKGAAYVMADLPAARGRLVGDLDLMVPTGEDRRSRACADREGLGAVGNGRVRPALLPGVDARDPADAASGARNAARHPPHDRAADRADLHPDAEALLAASVPLADPRLRVLGPRRHGAAQHRPPVQRRGRQAVARSFRPARPASPLRGPAETSGTSSSPAPGCTGSAGRSITCFATRGVCCARPFRRRVNRATAMGPRRGP